MTNTNTGNEWGWWAGTYPDMFLVGPFPTKEDAIQEALDQGAFIEIEAGSEWVRLVFYAECRGLYYDCGECGVVSRSM